MGLVITDTDFIAEAPRPLEPQENCFINCINADALFMRLMLFGERNKK